MGKDGGRYTGRKKQSQVRIINVFNSENTRYLVKKDDEGKEGKIG